MSLGKELREKYCHARNEKAIKDNEVDAYLREALSTWITVFLRPILLKVAVKGCYKFNPSKVGLYDAINWDKVWDGYDSDSDDEDHTSRLTEIDLIIVKSIKESGITVKVNDLDKLDLDLYWND